MGPSPRAARGNPGRCTFKIYHESFNNRVSNPGHNWIVRTWWIHRRHETIGKDIHHAGHIAPRSFGNSKFKPPGHIRCVG